MQALIHKTQTMIFIYVSFMTPFFPLQVGNSSFHVLCLHRNTLPFKQLHTHIGARNPHPHIVNAKKEKKTRTGGTDKEGRTDRQTDKQMGRSTHTHAPA